LSQVVGAVAELFRYPVKSMAGESVSTVEVDWQGIEGDRQFAFYNASDKGRFPWLTGRDVPEMVGYRTRFRDPDVPRHSKVEVETPDGQRLALDGETLRWRLAELAGADVRLMQLGRGAYDAMPISLVTTASSAKLDAAWGTPLDRRRFRLNIVIASEIPESEWHGQRLVFGGWKDSAELLVADAIERCVMVTIDPDTAEREPEIMKLVANQFDNRVGAYAVASRPGLIRRGDPVMIAD
jgi:uncharacterized protein YcbX